MMVFLDNCSPSSVHRLEGGSALADLNGGLEGQTKVRGIVDNNFGRQVCSVSSLETRLDPPSSLF